MMWASSMGHWRFLPWCIAVWYIKTMLNNQNVLNPTNVKGISMKSMKKRASFYTDRLILATLYRNTFLILIYLYKGQLIRKSYNAKLNILKVKWFEEKPRPNVLKYMLYLNFTSLTIIVLFIITFACDKQLQNFSANLNRTFYKTGRSRVIHKLVRDQSFETTIYEKYIFSYLDNIKKSDEWFQEEMLTNKQHYEYKSKINLW